MIGSSSTFLSSAAVVTVTYLMHSTLMLCGAWLVARCLRIKSPALGEWLWKLAAVAPLITVPLQFALGLSEPVLELASGDDERSVARIEQSASPALETSPDAARVFNGSADREKVELASSKVDSNSIEPHGPRFADGRSRALPRAFQGMPRTPLRSPPT